MSSIPFSESSSAWDLRKLDGAIQLVPPALVIEYAGEWIRYDDAGDETERTTWPPTRLELPLTDIVRIELQRRRIRASRIEIQARTITALQGCPLSKGVTCSIPIGPRHRDAAEALVAEVQMAIADGALRELLHEGDA